MKATFAVVSAVAAAMAVAACSSDNTGFNPKVAKGPDQSCVVGELTVGAVVTGDLSAASACSYPLFSDSTDSGIAVSYNFGAQAGHGYLVSLFSVYQSQLSMVRSISGKAQTVGYAWFYAPYSSAVPFVAQSNMAFSVRAGAYTNNPVDTGAYTLKVQSCNVPVPMITDSTTHSGNVGPGDCLEPDGDYEGSDSSYVQLYTVHFDSGSARTITLSGTGATLAYDMGGPQYDPFGYFPTGVWHGNDAVSSQTFTLTAPDSGAYTLVVGTNTFSATPQPYTLTVGAEQPLASRVTPPPAAAVRSVRQARKHGLTIVR